MTWSKDSEEAFPPRHPREPGGLRQDILDEIADHLACAAEREAECGGENDTEESAWGRVLERFGNPDAIARRLWWDQMRETVMREWIQTGVVVVVAVAVVVFMTLVMRQMNTANQAVLEALKRNATAANPLVTLKVKVTRGTEDGPPAEGVEVELAGAAFGSDRVQIRRLTDGMGVVTFGPMQPGQFEAFATDRKSGLRIDRTQAVTLFAGSDPETMLIVAPDVVPRETKIEFSEPLVLGDGHAIGASFFSEWRYGEVTWRGGTTAFVDDRGIRSLDADITDYDRYDLDGESRWSVFNSETYPFQVSGNVVKVGISFLTRGDDGKVQFGLQTQLDGEHISTLEGDAGLRIDLPDKFKRQIDDWRVEEAVKSKGISLHGPLYQMLRENYPELLPEAAVRVARSRSGFIVEGALVGNSVGSNHTSQILFQNWLLEGYHTQSAELLSTLKVTSVAVLEGPSDETLKQADGGRLLLALCVPRFMGKEFEQGFQIWPVLNGVLDGDWLPYELIDGPTLANGLKCELGPSPSATIPMSELTKKLEGVGEESRWILVDMSESLLGPNAVSHSNEFMLRWQNTDPAYTSQIGIVPPESQEIGSENRRPMWLVLKPMAAAEVAAAQ